MFAYHLHRRVGEVRIERRPRPAVVGALQHIRLEVVASVSIEGCVHGAFAVRARDHATYVGHVRHAREFLDLRPCRSAVARHLDEPVIGTHVQQSAADGRFVDRADVAEVRGSRVSRDRAVRPQLAHQRQLVAVELSRQVATECFPGVAAVRASEEVVRGEVQGPVIVRRDEQRRAPVPTQVLGSELRLRLDSLSLAGPYIVPDDAAILRLGIHDIRVGGIYRRVEAVAADGEVPVAVGYSLRVSRAARACEAVVVLKATVHVIGVPHVETDCVVLRDGQVADEVHRFTAVVRDVHTAVVADDEVVGVRRVDPHRVIVDVSGARDFAIREPSVLGHEERHAQQVDAIGVQGIDAHLAHEPRELLVRSLSRPARAVVIGPVHLGAAGLHGCVEGARV